MIENPLSHPVERPVSDVIGDNILNNFSGASIGYDFANSLSPMTPYPISMTRLSGAMRYNSTGLLEYAPENNLPYSEAFDLWSPSGATVSTNVILSPTGTLTADKIVETATNALHRVFQSLTITDQVATFSCYAKAAERNWMALYTGSDFFMFDLANGVLGSNSGNIGLSATITPADNGWYRCSVTSTYPSNGNTLIYISNSNSPTAYLGDGVSGLYVWGAQMERGAALRPYIPTNTTALYTPRFDYNPTTMQPRGYLMERQVTNLILQSNGFSTVSWTKADTIITANNAISPDGTMNADLLTEGAAGTAAIVQGSTGYVANSIITESIYLKRGNHDWIRIKHTDGSSTDGANVWFNLGTGQVGTIQLIGLGTGYTASIQPLLNGWYRCIVTGLPSAAATNAGILVSSAQGDLNGSRVNNGTRYQFGAQVEVGTCVTSLIITGTSTVTRSGDVAQRTLGSEYNQSEGTFFCESESDDLLPVNVVAVDDNTTSNRMNLRLKEPNNSQFLVVTSGSVVANLTKPTVVAGQIYKMAATYKLNNFNFTRNGTTVLTDVSGTVPPTTIMRLGIDNSISTGNLWIRKFAYWNYQRSNTDLVRITT